MMQMCQSSVKSVSAGGGILGSLAYVDKHCVDESAVERLIPE